MIINQSALLAASITYLILAIYFCYRFYVESEKTEELRSRIHDLEEKLKSYETGIEESMAE